MKKLLLLLLGFVFTISVYAQEPRSILKIKLSNNQPLTIEIDGRRFNKVNTRLTVGDLPKGRHRLKVYRYIANSNGSGGQAKLVFEGSVKIAPYTMAYCIVDARTGRMEFYERDIDKPNDADDREFNDDKTAANDTDDRRDGRNNDDRGSYNKKDVLSQKDVDNLKTLADARITDSDKLKLLQTELGKKYYTTEQVRTMMRWLSFESSKLDLAKSSFSRVTDKNNYKMLETEFTFSSSKEEFNEYINGK